MSTAIKLNKYLIKFKDCIRIPKFEMVSYILSCLLTAVNFFIDVFYGDPYQI